MQRELKTMGNPKNNYAIKSFLLKTFLMKKISIIAIACILSIFSCKKDDGVSCTTCSSSETTDFQVCEESDGNASVNGQNTGTAYDTYIAGLEQAGASCGN